MLSNHPADIIAEWNTTMKHIRTIVIFNIKDLPEFFAA